MQAGSGETLLPKSKRQRLLGSISAASSEGGIAAADASAGDNVSAGAARSRAPLQAPSKEAAVGWRVCVAERAGSRRLVNAVVRDYDPPTGAPPTPPIMPIPATGPGCITARPPALQIAYWLAFPLSLQTLRTSGNICGWSSLPGCCACRPVPTEIRERQPGLAAPHRQRAVGVCGPVGGVICQVIP